MGLAIFRKNGRILITSGSRTLEPLVDADPDGARRIAKMLLKTADEAEALDLDAEKPKNIKFFRKIPAGG